MFEEAKVIITEQEIAKKVEELASRVDADYNGKEIIVVSVLKGGFVFTADLVRKMKTPVNINFMEVSSYGQGTVSAGSIKILRDLDVEITDRDVLIVEDIFDTGITLANLKEMLMARGAKSVEICCMLTKPARRKIHIDIKYIGFEIPDEFVVGYGLDYAEKYRNLPYIGILDPKIYLEKEKNNG